MNDELFDNLTKGHFYKRLFAFMKEVGLQKIDVNYSGGGDSGGMDNMDFYPAVNRKIEDAITEELEEDLCNPIYNRHGGFADGGGYYVNGTVSYRADKNEVWISGTDHITEYNYDADSENEDDYEEESRDEDWEECLYNSDRFESKEEVDFQFIYYYSKYVIGGKLPEVYHNRLLAEASTTEDEYAIRYVKEI